MISLLSFFRFVISFLLNIALEVLTLNQIGDIILLVVLLALTTGLVLLHVLVALGELAERGQGVGAELVQDTGDELGELLVVGTGALVDLLDLAAGSTLASVDLLVDCFVCGSLGFQVFG